MNQTMDRSIEQSINQSKQSNQSQSIQPIQPTQQTQSTQSTQTINPINPINPINQSHQTNQSNQSSPFNQPIQSINPPISQSINLPTNQPINFGAKLSIASLETQVRPAGRDNTDNTPAGSKALEAVPQRHAGDLSLPPPPKKKKKHRKKKRKKKGPLYSRAKPMRAPVSVCLTCVFLQKYILLYLFRHCLSFRGPSMPNMVLLGGSSEEHTVLL